MDNSRRQVQHRQDLKSYIIWMLFMFQRNTMMKIIFIIARFMIYNLLLQFAPNFDIKFPMIHMNLSLLVVLILAKVIFVEVEKL